jgi:hypothetical protein
LEIGDKKAKEENLARSFIGVIEYIEYDEKGIPTVIVNGQKYYLSTSYNFEHKLEKNDSLIKYKNSTIYKLVKNGTNQVILFGN